MRHLDQQRERVVRVIVERGVERLGIELADLGRELGELGVAGQLRPAGGPRRGLPLP
ncbi:MAG TPA: hypothetical protein VGD68_00350 [Streptosporangiaceae bacterium]